VIPVADETEKPACETCGKKINKIHYTHRHAICEACWQMMREKAKPVDTKLQGLWWAGKEYE
jgi:hypothetical protein